MPKPSLVPSFNAGIPPDAGVAREFIWGCLRGGLLVGPVWGLFPELTEVRWVSFYYAPLYVGGLAIMRLLLARE